MSLPLQEKCHHEKRLFDAQFAKVLICIEN